MAATAPSAFVGRETELARLTAALEAAAQGRAPAIIVEGESGAGKTRLLREFVVEVNPADGIDRGVLGCNSERIGDPSGLHALFDVEVELAIDRGRNGPLGQEQLRVRILRAAEVAVDQSREAAEVGEVYLAKARGRSCARSGAPGQVPLAVRSS